MDVCAGQLQTETKQEWLRPSSAPWSCGLIRHVLDQEVGGSNPGKSESSFPGGRLDLP